jgi:hypothetical protein
MVEGSLGLRKLARQDDYHGVAKLGARIYGGDNFAASFRAPQPAAVLVVYLEFTIDTDELNFAAPR